MFRSTTIIRELVLNLAKIIFMLKHSLRLRRYILFGDVAACYRAAHSCRQGNNSFGKMLHVAIRD